MTATAMRLTSATIDLDGTLADTVVDLHAACIAMLADLGRPERSLESVRSFVGQGMKVLVERCLDGHGTTPEPLLAEGVASFRRHYAQCNGRDAKLFPGALEGLDVLRREGLALACVTNKPAEFTLPLLDALGIAGYFSAVVSGDTLPVKKPHPEPIRHACKEIGSRPDDNVHIGDSRHDYEAAHAAGCCYFHVPYGYNDQPVPIAGAGDAAGLAIDAGRVATGKCDALVSDLVEAARRIAAYNRDRASA